MIYILSIFDENPLAFIDVYWRSNQIKSYHEYKYSSKFYNLILNVLLWKLNALVTKIIRVSNYMYE